MKIQFLGAADCVTGSCHLLSTDNHQILLDCGMFQGGKALESRNDDPFPFDPKKIDCVIVSHAHVDHSGRLPLLVKQGFSGPIYCTDATADLLTIMLPDSAHIQESDAERASRKALRRGEEPVEPLYTMADADAALKLIRPVLYDTLFEINDQMKACFNEAGHILGSAITEIWVTEENETKKIVYTGDIGMSDRPILRDPKKIKKADYVIMESTYGDRLHEGNKECLEQLIQVILRTVKRGGNVVIPAFAVGRTQELIYELNIYYEDHPEYRSILDRVDVYIDSPMAISTTEIFRRNAQVFDDATRDRILSGDNPLDFKNLYFSRTADESKALNQDKRPKILIAASGMCDAGRIRHHLKHNLWNKNSTIVFVGYQAEGSLGRMLLDGAKKVTLFGEKIAVNAEVVRLEGFSGHGDQKALVDWVKGIQKAPRQIFLVHGEEPAKDILHDLIEKETGYPCVAVPGVSAFTLADVPRMNRQEAQLDMTEGAEAAAILEKIQAVQEHLSSLLEAGLEEGLSGERRTALMAQALQLEKDTLNLGMLLSAWDQQMTVE
ncbi:MAG: MBL fold metallo-hydrolase [Clostridiales bacterium]|nr:MBL fold metallo-hydrolase [Clostridiales bacterium]